MNEVYLFAVFGILPHLPRIFCNEALTAFLEHKTDGRKVIARCVLVVNTARLKCDHGPHSNTATGLTSTQVGAERKGLLIAALRYLMVREASITERKFGAD